MNQRRYEFEYKVEGSTYQSNDHISLSDARKEVERLRKIYKQQGFMVTETWIYVGDDFKGRW